MSTVVLISSHDKYNFAWEGCVHGFNKYWPDCPWQKYFVTNELSAPIGKTIKTGVDLGWERATRQALMIIPPKSTVLFTLEDYWLTAKVDTRSLQEFATYIDTGRAQYIRLNPSADATVDSFDDRLAFYVPNAAYPTSLNMSLWNAEYFLSLLRQNQSIWDFESAGLKGRHMFGHMAVREWKYVHYIHPDDPNFQWKDSGAASQSKLTSSAEEYLKREGLV